MGRCYFSYGRGCGIKSEYPAWALEVALGKRKSMPISTSEVVKIAKFVLQNNYFKFNGETKQQISGSAIGTTYAPLYDVYSWAKLRQNFWRLKFSNR